MKISIFISMYYIFELKKYIHERVKCSLDQSKITKELNGFTFA